jgi:hypothetical protein
VIKPRSMKCSPLEDFVTSSQDPKLSKASGFFEVTCWLCLFNLCQKKTHVGYVFNIDKFDFYLFVQMGSVFFSRFASWDFFILVSLLF